MKINVAILMRVSALGCALLLAAAVPASSAFVYTLGQGWQELNFDLLTPSPFDGGYGGTVDDPWDPYSTYNTPWQFSVTVESYLRFTGVGDKGSYYRIWDYGVDLHTTPEVPFEMSNLTDPDVAWSDPSWSSGTLSVGPGDYRLNFQNVLFTDGLDAFEHLPEWFQGASTAYFRVDPIPEPTGLVLMGLGLVGLVAAYRRRRKN